MNEKRITLFCGHYGSGKTNVAVNYALWLKKRHERVTVADLDIVNPYFRTKDSLPLFRAMEIGLIASPYANSNLDIPALPQEMYAVTDDRGLYAVLDVGGDDRGALALGRLSPAILEEGNYEMLAVVNRYRPLTQTVADTVGVLREVEAAAGIAFTGLVNNSNLGEETTADTVLASLDYANGVAAALGVPVMMTAFEEKLKGALTGRVLHPFPLILQPKIQ